MITPLLPPPIRRAARRALQRGLAASALLLTAWNAQAALVTAGAPLTQLPGALVDPLASLGLAADQFLVPVQVQDAEALQQWQFSLQFDASVAAPVDGGGLFQSVYQADFGNGQVSEISSSGVLLDGLLEDVSGWFAPGVDGSGMLAYVLFQYLPGHQGQDPSTSVPGEPGTPGGDVPEPPTPALVLAALGVAAASWRGRPAVGRPARPFPTLTHKA